MGWPRTAVASGAASAVSGASNSRHRGLRAGLAALALILMAPAGAVAADMPEFLRGSFTPSSTRWDGFYFGGQAGKTFGSADFGNADNSLVSYMLANTELQSIVSNFTTLPKGSTGSPSYGGFVGYNWQWDDVVLGGELNYNHMSIGIGAHDTLGPILVPGANLPDGSTVVYSVTVTSSCFGDNPRHRDGAGARRLDLRPLHAIRLCRPRGRPGRRLALCNPGRHHQNDDNDPATGRVITLRP